MPYDNGQKARLIIATVFAGIGFWIIVAALISQMVG